jgi:hypothetical protein
LGGTGVLVARATVVFPDTVVRWVGTIFSGAFVPVIPLPENLVKRAERNP